jgi:hypothetical protein
MGSHLQGTIAGDAFTGPAGEGLQERGSAAMPDLTPAQQRRVDGICHHIDEYLTLRFSHAERVNPKIGGFVDDLRAQMQVNLREVLTKAKAWGVEKVMIADVLCGDNLNRRFEVLNTTGQYSILHEIVSALDEHERGADAIRITNMRNLYEAIDPTIGTLIELAQTWLWWDLPDAVCLQAYFSQVQRIRRLVDLEITPQVMDFYRTALNLGPQEEITRDQMIAHEYRRLRRLLLEFELRRRDDLAHMEVLRREVVDDAGVHEMIRELAREIEALDHLAQTEELDDRIRGYYAKKLATDPAHVGREHALRWQREHVEEMKNQLHIALATGQVLGPPENFKMVQLDQMKAELQSIMPLVSDTARELAEKMAAAEVTVDRGPVRA